jgi:hypothetical protein
MFKTPKDEKTVSFAAIHAELQDRLRGLENTVTDE